MDRIDKQAVGCGVINGSAWMLMCLYQGVGIDFLDIASAFFLGIVAWNLSLGFMLKRELKQVDRQLKIGRKERIRALGLGRSDRDV